MPHNTDCLQHSKNIKIGNIEWGHKYPDCSCNLTKGSMAELLSGGARPSDFKLIDGKLYEKEPKRDTDRI